jgi:Acetyltransferase (GNAT) domain
MSGEGQDQVLFPAAGCLAPWAKAEARVSGRQHISINGGGVFPLLQQGSRLVPLRTDLSFSGLPRVCASGAIASLFSQTGASSALFANIPATGPFWDSLPQTRAVLRHWERACLDIKGSYEAWFEDAFERKRRKEYRRLRARLGETGRAESLSLPPGSDPSAWVDELFALEAKGWKGRRGTAIASHEKTAAALKDALKELGAAGHLRFWKLALDGRPLAMMFALVDQDEAWLGKIAYDEDFAKFSPGVLLILDATESFFAEGGINRVDSCAIPDHPMINHIWRNRLPMADVLVAAPDAPPLAFGALVAWERFKRAARTQMRDAYYRMTKRRRS